MLSVKQATGSTQVIVVSENVKQLLKEQELGAPPLVLKTPKRSIEDNENKSRKPKQLCTAKVPPYTISRNPALRGFSERSSCEFKMTNVVWRETKVGNNRWLLDVEGEMIPQKPVAGSGLCGVYIICGDQIATKIGRQDYEVDMVANMFNIGTTDNLEKVDLNKKMYLIEYLMTFYERKEQLLKRKKSLGTKQEGAHGAGLATIATVLNRESASMLHGANGFLSSSLSHAQASNSVKTLKYFTEKGKTITAFDHNTTPRKVTFGPAIGTQYHWFLVSEIKIARSGKCTSDGTPVFEFHLTSNKFQYSFGKPTPEVWTGTGIWSNSMGIQKCENVKPDEILGTDSYRCSRYPVSKSKFLNKILCDMKIKDVDKKREVRAQNHFLEAKAEKLHYNSLKSFTDVDGKTYRYTGMPVGGSHLWYYRDSIMQLSEHTKQ